MVELVRVRRDSEHRIERIKDAPVLRLRDKLLPLVDLKALLGFDRPEKDETDRGFIVVTQVGRQTFGIMVDSVFHTEEIVVKPMSSKLRHIDVFSGNTILGDGSVILIIDPNGVAQASRHRRNDPRRRSMRCAETNSSSRRRRPSRCSCSAPDRRSRRPCRCRWSPGSK